MLGENLKRLRTERGLSQEEMARRLHVVRQTVSKWERGVSVPDADVLRQIGELFGVSVSQLVGEAALVNTEEIALQLALLNQRLDNRERRLRTVLKCAVWILVGILAMWMILRYGRTVQIPVKMPAHYWDLNCILGEESWYYSISCDENMEVVSYGGDAWLHENVVEPNLEAQVTRLKAEDLITLIEEYFQARGGSVEVTELDPNERAKPQYPIYAEGSQ